MSRSRQDRCEYWQGPGQVRYRVRYEAATYQTLDRYLSEHAPRLRADFAAHFPTGVQLTREVWETVQV